MGRRQRGRICGRGASRATSSLSPSGQSCPRKTCRNTVTVAVHRATPLDRNNTHTVCLRLQLLPAPPPPHTVLFDAEISTPSNFTILVYCRPGSSQAEGEGFDTHSPAGDTKMIYWFYRFSIKRVLYRTLQNMMIWKSPFVVLIQISIIFRC